MISTLAPHLLFLSSLLLFIAIHTCFATRTPLGFRPHRQQATWQDFNNLLNSKRGSHAQGFSKLNKYFHQFGYFPTSMENPNFTSSNTFDTHLEHALARYQRWHGLPVTRVLDHETLSRIMTPRCGAPDTKATTSLHVTQHYVYFDGQPRWARQIPMTLTYSFSRENFITYLSMQDVRSAFRRAFDKWESTIPISFKETYEYTEADVKIGFYGGDHGDGEAFDGPLGVLAHAFSPDNGRLHLDTAEKWAVDFGAEKSKVAVDLESVALHEIGHVLGLAHSMDKDAVMYPSLKPRAKKLDLSLDDIQGVQALYGSNPNFTIGSLLESETSSSSSSYRRGVGLGGKLSYWTYPIILMWDVALGNLLFKYHDHLMKRLKGDLGDEVGDMVCFKEGPGARGTLIRNRQKISRMCGKLVRNVTSLIDSAQNPCFLSLFQCPFHLHILLDFD